MPTRKVSDRERLTIWARSASDDQIAEAEEIIRVEKAARRASKPSNAPARQRNRTTTARKDPANNAEPTDGPVQ